MSQQDSELAKLIPDAKQSAAFDDWDALSTQIGSKVSQRPPSINEQSVDEDGVIYDDWDNVQTVHLRDVIPKFTFFTEDEVKEKVIEEAQKQGQVMQELRLEDLMPPKVFDNWIVVYMHDIPVKVVDAGYFPLLVLYFGRVPKGMAFVKLGACQTISSKHANVAFNVDRRCFELEVISNRGVVLNGQDVFPKDGAIPLEGESTLGALCDARLLERNGKQCSGHNEVKIVVGSGELPEGLRRYQYVKSNVVREMRDMGFGTGDARAVMDQMHKGSEDAQRRENAKVRLKARWEYEDEKRIMAAVGEDKAECKKADEVEVADAKGGRGGENATRAEGK